MKLIYALLFLTITTLSETSILPESHRITRRNVSTDLKFITNFSWKLFSNSKLDEQESNHVMSPISVHICLAILQQTAAGRTKRQFDNLIGTYDPQIINDALLKMKESRKDNELQSATAIFPIIDYTLNETFASNARNVDVNVVPVDFRDFNSTEKVINSWVSEVTRGEIPRIIEPNEDISKVKLLLANAIYFRGSWKMNFSDNIEDGDFYSKPTESMKVKYMKMNERLKYGSKHMGVGGIGYRWIELPYKNDEFSMFIVMPTQRWGLEAMIKEFSEADLINMMDSNYGSGHWKYTDMNLKLPKFSVKSKISLIDTLIQLGLKDVFTGMSQLPYLANGKSLSISKAIQQAVLKVDEKGTVASGVTAFYLAETTSAFVLRIRHDFIVDQPFLSIIIDRKQNIPVFISKIYNPEILN